MCTELVVSLTFLFYPCGWVLAVNSLVYREFLVCLAGSLDGDREMHRIPHAEAWLIAGGYTVSRSNKTAS